MSVERVGNPTLQWASTLAADPDGDVYIEPKEWEFLVQYVTPKAVVQATGGEPPMFWFEGRRFRVRRP